MKFEHTAMWTHDLEGMRTFYEKYFGGVPNDKFVSDEEFDGHFESYFLTFAAGSRLELMELTGIPQGDNANGFESTGLTHIAFSAETRAELDGMFAAMQGDGVVIVGKPHVTGDGYYEACVLDPDGNRVEITVTP